MFDKIVLVTRATRLQGLIARFNTLAQARFYLEHAGVDFASYLEEHDAYQRSLEIARRGIELGLHVQILDRALVPTYSFSPKDLIVTLGQDGLVANTAKYVGGQPIVAINPDPKRFDGILLPFKADNVSTVLRRTIEGKVRLRSVTMAEAKLQDGQRLLAFNDLYVGAESHVSARYKIRHTDRSEQQSSSGVLICTGAGSTGWLSSVFQQTSGVLSFLGKTPVEPPQVAWEDQTLLFIVREPFLSLHSQTGIVAGRINNETKLTIESQMPSSGVIFSDGVESDRIDFHSGAVATIGTAFERATLVVG